MEKGYFTKWQQEHWEERKEYIRKWRQENRDKINISERKQRQRLKQKILSHYSQGKPRCATCGENDLDMLCLDHIKGDGAEHRRIIGGRSLYEWARANNYPDIFQVLCYNCNMKKRMSEGK